MSKSVYHVSEDPAAALAIPLETLSPLLTQHCLDPRTTRILGRDENFQAVQFRCDQIFYVHSFRELRLQIPVSISPFAAEIRCGRDPLKKALTHGLEPSEPWAGF
jgi:hypothetical protein